MDQKRRQSDIEPDRQIYRIRQTTRNNEIKKNRQKL